MARQLQLQLYLYLTAVDSHTVYAAALQISCLGTRTQSILFLTEAKYNLRGCMRTMCKWSLALARTSSSLHMYASASQLQLIWLYIEHTYMLDIGGMHASCLWPPSQLNCSDPITNTHRSFSRCSQIGRYTYLDNKLVQLLNSYCLSLPLFLCLPHRLRQLPANCYNSIVWTYVACCQLLRSYLEFVMLAGIRACVAFHSFTLLVQQRLRRTRYFGGKCQLQHYIRALTE